ncbi:hypothetical protein [Clostridium sp.]|uniref:hypothetical protein n=1 Tax=Clostridium sp. TaxID=1506 RepID=UPI003F4BB222
MKKETMAYITALTDVYSGTINQPMIKCLNDLLTFVVDIPEENKEQSITSFNIALENENIKQENAELLNRVMEFENSCENMCEVEKNLQGKVKGAMDNNVALNSTCNKLRDKNKYLLRLNSVLDQRNKKLLYKNSKLTKLFS